MRISLRRIPLILALVVAAASSGSIAHAHTGTIDTLFGGGNPNGFTPEQEANGVRDRNGKLVRMYGQFPKAHTLKLPNSVAIDEMGNVYVADASHGVIYRVTRGKTNGWSTVNPPNVQFTQNGLRWQPGFAGENRIAADAKFNNPASLVFKPDGTLLLADIGNHRIRGIRAARPGAALDYQSKVVPFAGTGEMAWKIGLTALKSDLAVPYAVAVGKRGVYVIDQCGARLSVIGPDGTMKVLVGGGMPIVPIGGKFGVRLEDSRFGYNGEGLDASAVLVNQMGAVAEFPNGDVIFTDSYNDRVRVIDAKTNRVRTVAGTGEPGFNGFSGVATELELNHPTGIVVHPNGYEVLISERENHLVRRLNLKTGHMTTIAGTGEPGYNGDNIPATKAQLHSPLGMAITAKGELVVADSNNRRVRIIDAGLLPGTTSVHEAQIAEDSFLAELDADDRRKAEQADRERARRARKKANRKLRQVAAQKVEEQASVEDPAVATVSETGVSKTATAETVLTEPVGAAVTKKRSSPKTNAVSIDEPWKTVGDRRSVDEAIAEPDHASILAREAKQQRSQRVPGDIRLLHLSRELANHYNQFKIRNLASPDAWENRWDAHIGARHGTKSAAQRADRERPRLNGQSRSYFFGRDRAFKAVDTTLRAFISHNLEVRNYWTTSEVPSGVEERLILEFNPQMAAIGRQTRGMDTTCSNLRVVFVLEKDGLSLKTAYPYLPD